ncbi:MAG: hypothetical protein H6569_05945 [Lewinellaceae bacterium]|nr:hypothetical protein [Lewinellaceae bacterium]
MSKVSFNSIVPLVVESSPANGVQSLLREIIVLQAKLDRIDRQDFYFQMGQKSNQKRLDELKVKYNQIVDWVNNNDVDFFLEQIKEAENKSRQFCTSERSQPVFAKIMVDVNTKSQINYFKMLLQAKSQYKKLKTLNELMNDETSLMEIFE